MKRIWPALIALLVAAIGGYLAFVPLQQSLSGDDSLVAAPHRIPAHVVVVRGSFPTRGGASASTFVSSERRGKPKPPPKQLVKHRTGKAAAQAPTFVASTPATRPATSAPT